MNKSVEKVEIKKKSKVKKIINWVITVVFGSLIATILVFNLVNKYSGDGFIFGSQYPMVLTDSMEPEYKVGDVLVINKVKDFDELVEQYRLGDDGLSDTEDDAIVATQPGLITLTEGATIDLTFNYDIMGIGKEYSVTHRLSKVVIHEDLEAGQGRFLFTTHGINTNSEQCAVNGGDCTNQLQNFNETKVIGKVQGVSAFLTFVYSVFTSVWGLLVLILLPAIYLIITSVIDIVKSMSEGEKASPSSNENSPQTNELLSSLSPEDLERLKKEMLNELLEKGGGKK